MPILLPNIYFDTWRSTYTASRGTSVPLPNLSSIEGHLTRKHDAELVIMSNSALQAQYEIYTVPSLDIRIGDVIKNIILKSTGRQWFIQTDSETWRVTKCTIAVAGGFLEYRDITIEREVGGGPAQIG